jgi:thioredoxin reductase
MNAGASRSLSVDARDKMIHGIEILADAVRVTLGPKETRNPLETSRRGIFAIGDVRSGSTKRVAAAVGEGAQVVATLHAPLPSMESNIPGEPGAQRD